MWRYWVLLTDLRLSEVEALQSEVAAGKLHPMELKKRLARTITAGFHGEEAAQSADENWARMFQQKGESEDLEEVMIAFADISNPQGEVLVTKLLVKTGLAASGSEASRKVSEGAVRIDGDVVDGVRIHLSKLPPCRIVVRLGKRAKVAVIA
jgi:tyrosyl-tRNA synthetase